MSGYLYNKANPAARMYQQVVASTMSPTVKASSPSTFLGNFFPDTPVDPIVYPSCKTLYPLQNANDLARLGWCWQFVTDSGTSGTPVMHPKYIPYTAMDKQMCAYRKPSLQYKCSGLESYA